MLQSPPSVVLKLSGEVLSGAVGFGLDAAVLDSIARQLVRAQQKQARAAVVIGGGNIFRGLHNEIPEMDRVTGDEMGMLATVINGLALRDAILRAGGSAMLFTARPMGPIGTPYVRDAAAAAMADGKLLILSGGTGNPFFSTDTGAALRAAELGLDLYLKGTKVDGVYDRDPAVHADAKRFDSLTFDELIQRQLGIMDLTAATLLRQNRVSALVYRMTEPDSVYHAALGQCNGTLITP